jgi:signal transduction histidine kinase
VQPLVTELNSLIDQQEREIERSRGRAADLAHGLKTPLAALTGDVGRLRQIGQSQIADDVQSVAEQMRRHVDRELARARVKGVKRYAGGVRTELAPLVRSIIDTVARTTEGEKHRFEEAVPLDLSIPFERADLAEVLGNLIENACRFARHTVRISAGSEEITVEDDGPGIGAEHLPKVLERGGRLDESGGGAGLGLSIAQDVLDAYGWELSLGHSESLGGLLVALRPRRATASVS